MTTDAEHVRITPHPAQALVVPLVQRTHVEVDGDGWLTFSGPTVAVELPSELIVRDLLQLDCDNSAAVCEFLNRYGTVDFDPEAASGLWPWYLMGDQPDVPPSVLLRQSEQYHVVQVKFGLGWIQAAVMHWLAYMEDRDPAPAWQPRFADQLTIQAYDGQTGPWWLFGRTFAALQRLHPTVAITRGDKGSYGTAPQPVGILTGLCVQLFNLVVEGPTVLACANETCGQRFIHQQDRSRKGISRSKGVRFCTAACAKAQVQREYRRRKSAKERKGLQ